MSRTVEEQTLPYFQRGSETTHSIAESIFHFTYRNSLLIRCQCKPLYLSAFHHRQQQQLCRRQTGSLSSQRSVAPPPVFFSAQLAKLLEFSSIRVFVPHVKSKTHTQYFREMQRLIFTSEDYQLGRNFSIKNTFHLHLTLY